MYQCVSIGVCWDVCGVRLVCGVPASVCMGPPCVFLGAHAGVSIFRTIQLYVNMCISVWPRGLGASSFPGKPSGLEMVAL